MNNPPPGFSSSFNPAPSNSSPHTVMSASSIHASMRHKKDFEDGFISGFAEDGGAIVQVSNREFPHASIKAGGGTLRDYNHGDLARVGFAHGSKDLGFLFPKNRTPGTNGGLMAQPPVSAYLRGLWDQGQSWPGLTSLGTSHMTLITMSSQPGSNWPTTHPQATDANNGILGLVVWQGGSLPQVGFLYQEILITTTQLRLACWAMHFDTNNADLLWDIALPSSSYPTMDSTYEEGYTGNKWDFLFHDETNKTLNVIGHGSPTRRRQIWTVSETGTVLAEFTSPYSMLQSSYFNNRWIKGWCRFGSENSYDQVDSLIRCYKRTGSTIIATWTVDPASLLPSNQLASHSNSGLTTELESQNWANQTTGRLAVDPSALSSIGKICIWVSGIVAGLTVETSPLDSYAAVMLAGGGGIVLDGSGFPHPLPPCSRTTLPEFAAHKAQNAALVHLRGTTGNVLNRHDITFSISTAIYETISIDSWSTYHAANVATPTVDGIATLQEAALQGFGGTIDKNYTYGGLAGDLALSLASPGTMTFSGDIGDLEPYSATWRFEGGYGFSAPYDGTIVDCSHCPTPPYVYLLDSHIRLQPLPRTTCPDGELGEDGLPPHDLALTSLTALTTVNPVEMRRLDPLGGVTVEDTEGVCWSAYTRTTAPIVYGSKNLLSQITSMEYTYDPDTESITVQTDQTTYQLGHVDWGVTTKLVKILADGTATEYDIGYKFSSCVVPGAPEDTVTSTREREYAGKIYQIIPCPLAGTVVLIRDKIDGLSDGGYLENVPYLVIEVRLYSDPSTIVEAYQLSDNTLETPTDPDTMEPLLQRRQYQQYDLNNGRLIGNCRGSIDSTSGREQLMQVLSIVQNSDSVVYYRAIRLYWPFGGTTTLPQVDLMMMDSATPEFSNPLLWQSWCASAFTGGKTIFPGPSRKTTDGYNGWCVVIRDS